MRSRASGGAFGCEGARKEKGPLWGPGVSRIDVARGFQTARVRPPTRLMMRTTRARTSSRCMKPPKVYEVTNPSSQRTKRITKIVQSTFDLLDFATDTFLPEF